MAGRRKREEEQKPAEPGGEKKAAEPGGDKKPAKANRQKPKAAPEGQKPEPNGQKPERNGQKAERNGQKAEQNGQTAPQTAARPHRNPQLTTAEWRKIKIEYVKGKTTLRKLAEKWNIGESTIRKRASKEGWRKRKNKLDAEVEQKTLERVCDARAREFEAIARINDQMSDALENMVKFITEQPPAKYDELRGVESLTKAIAQVVQIKRDLYNIPNAYEQAKIESLREKSRLEREKNTTEPVQIRITIEGDEKQEDLDG